jgi:co-chaperonin GroES (HSP10)
MAITHQPTHDWIVVQVQKETGTMPLVRGLFQPTADVKPKKYGTVIAVGPGRMNAHGFCPPLPCAVGDTVMLREVAGEAVVVDGEQYHWCIPDEILATVHT